MRIVYKGNDIWWLHSTPSEKYLEKMSKQDLEKLHFLIEVALKEYDQQKENL